MPDPIQVTFDGAIFTRQAELCFFLGEPARPFFDRQKQWLDGWIPIRLYWQEGKPIVDWCYLGERRFTDPFFSQTVEDCLRRPFNLLFRHQTPIEVLGKWHEFRPGLTPNGFIFHLIVFSSRLL